jgi:hypothetical protein
MEQTVCGNWHSHHERTFTFLNPGDQDAHITKYEKYEWPFTADEKQGITVPKRGANGPGRKDCELKALPDGHYKYWVDTCPSEGAPQNVTIP